MSPKEQVVIITGSASGIGRAIALEFCKQGAKVVLNGRNPDKLKDTESAFKKEGYEVLSVVADVTVYSDCERLVASAKERFGKVDVLIANAGITMNERFEDLDPETFKLIMDSQIIGSAYPVRAALSEIKKTKGSIVFISSAGALLGLPTVSAYCAGKMALTAFTQSLRVELAKTGIHIGLIYLSFTENEPSKAMVTAYGKKVPVTPRPIWAVSSRSKVARKVVRCVRWRRRMMVVSFLGKTVYYLTRMFPNGTNRLVCWWEGRKK